MDEALQPYLEWTKENNNIKYNYLKGCDYSYFRSLPKAKKVKFYKSFLK